MRGVRKCLVFPPLRWCGVLGVEAEKLIQGQQGDFQRGGAHSPARLQLRDFRNQHSLCLARSDNVEGKCHGRDMEVGRCWV